ncbi:hypothetical protein JMA_14460 [Jeotgalibacillus malaysiensis]|uniref:Uncharacterized protein n=1 Tax=Jeotgalibacillus malaysiensis TaxID=1508404 RepID=A0A0B5AQE8_9BACL|nr:hypothetical protein JMA_14460 [Jeotgalibacillus malaysiensis]
MTPVPANPVRMSDFVYETFSSLMMTSSYVKRYVFSDISLFPDVK